MPSTIADPKAVLQLRHVEPLRQAEFRRLRDRFHHEPDSTIEPRVSEAGARAS
jgi:hypothetical protein